MNSSSANAPVCRVSGAEKLPADLGGADGICLAIQEAFADASVEGPVSVDVTIRSPRLLAATVKRGGVVQPEMTMDVFDSTITKVIIERFAQSVARAAGS